MKLQLIEPPDVEIKLIGKDRKEYVYKFYFYQATWTGSKIRGTIHARYIAVCNTVGCEDVFGQGIGYHMAMTDCFNKLVGAGKIKLPE